MLSLLLLMYDTNTSTARRDDLAFLLQCYDCVACMSASVTGVGNGAGAYYVIVIIQLGNLGLGRAASSLRETLGVV